MTRWGEWEISAISGRLLDSPGELAYIDPPYWKSQKIIQTLLLFHDMVVSGHLSYRSSYGLLFTDLSG